MYCPNCGAKIEDVRCPYCGYEDENEAAKRHEAELADIYKRADELVKKPEKAVKKASSALVRICIAIVILFIAGIAVATVYSKFAPELEYNKQQAELETLEEVYQSGDYAELPKLLADIDGAYQAVYGKYRVVGNIYYDLEMYERDCCSTIEFVAGYPDGYDLLDYEFEGFFSILYECGELRNAGFVYGEGAAIEKAETKVTELLRDLLCLSDEEISDGMEIFMSDSKDYGAMSKTAAERLAKEE